MTTKNRYRIQWGYAALTLVATLVLLGAGLSRLGIETDIVKALPQHDPVVADAGYIFANHPFHDTVVIDIEVTRGGLEDLVRAGNFVEKKLLESGLFRKIGSRDMQALVPELMGHIVENLPILFTRTELDQKVRPLLAKDRIDRQLQDTYKLLTGMEGIGQADWIAKDPLGLRAIAMARLAYLAPSRNARIYQGHLVTNDGRHLMLTANPVQPGTDTRFSRKLTRALKAVTTDLEQSFQSAGAAFRVTPVGAYRAALDNEIAIRTDIGNALLLATIGIAFLLIFSFPRPVIGLLSFLPAVCGTVAALFLFSLLHDKISLLALGFGGAIISITVDHGIAYLLFLDRPYETKGKEASREVRAVGLLATLTTIGAFASLSVSGFPILLQIGQFAALGIGCSFLFVHTVFPRIIPSLPPARRKRALPLEKAAGRLATFGGYGKAAIALFFSGGMLFFAYPRFQVDLASMNSVSPGTLAAEEVISSNWGDVLNSTYLLIEGDDIRQLQAAGDQVARQLAAEVADHRIKPLFLPSMVFPGEEQARKNRLAWQQFWGAAGVEKVRREIISAASAAGFSGQAFTPFFRRISGGDYKAVPIPESLFSLLGISHGKQTGKLMLFVTLKPDTHYQAERFFDQFRQAGPVVRIFDASLFSKRLGNTLFQTFLKMMGIISLSVLFLLVPFFMDWKLTLISLLPIGFSLVCTLGTLNLLGEPLGIPGLMLSIVIIGMGVDYSLYLVKSGQRYLDEHHPNQGPIRMAVILASTSTLIGFGVLCFSKNALLRNMGLSCVLGIGYALVGAFALVPPLLRLAMRSAGQPAGGGAVIPGSLAHRKQVMRRYQSMETFPRMFVWFKMKLDPMFPDLAKLVGQVGTIMDIGCGYGIPSSWLLELLPKARVLGIEPDEVRVRVAERAIGENGRIQEGAAPDIPETTEPVDIAMMLDMLHYLNDADLETTLRRIQRKLKENGRLLIRVTIPVAGQTPWFRWVETRRLRLHGMRYHYRQGADIKAVVEQNGFIVTMMEPSAPGREETWLLAKVQ